MDLTIPELSPPIPPQMLISMSAEPCTPTRCSWSTDSVRSALPAMRPKFQPRPSRNRPGTRNAVRPAARAVSAVAATRVALPTMMAGRRPIRSVSPADDGREQEHPRHVDAEDLPDQVHVVAVLLHVRRRHGHHCDHHGLRHGHGDERQPGGRSRPDPSHRIGERREAGGVRADTAGDDQRVGAEQDGHDDRGRRPGGRPLRHRGPASSSRPRSRPRRFAGPTSNGPVTDPSAPVHTSVLM